MALTISYKNVNMKNTVSTIIKKMTCFIISLTFIMIYPINSIAIQEATESLINVLDYSIEDLKYMSAEEFNLLLNAYERDYDPFDTYGTESQLTQIDDGISVQWEAGKKDLSETGTHQLITAKACSMMIDYIGFWADGDAGILLALSVSLASSLPDWDGVVENHAFAGHFYDPQTGKNWAGSTTNTAKTNTVYEYNRAKSEFTSNGITEEFCEYVGRMAHYIQDANVPHHAANITVVNPAHAAFEKFANDNIDSYLDVVPKFTLRNFRYAVVNDVGTIVHECALVAKEYSGAVNNVLNKTNWDSVARNSVIEATKATTELFFKLTSEADIPLH